MNECCRPRMKLFSRLTRGCIPNSDYAPVDPQEMEIIEANNNFGFNLIRTCRSNSKEGNLFFSPFSIGTALGMTLVGACGQTRSQMLETMQLGDTTENEIQQGCQKLLTSVQKTGPGSNLETANGIFVNSKYKLLEEYLDTLQKYFQASSRNVDFSGNTEAARLEINGWVEDATKGKIEDLLAEGVLDSLTRLVIVNAVYFKGMWSHPFVETKTFKSTFHVSSENTIEIEMMKQTGEFNYGIFPDLQCACVELPYLGNRLAMLIILPDEIDGLKNVEQTLDAEVLHHVLSSMHPMQDLQLFMPRFKVEETLSLQTYLKAMGMTEAFDEVNADFSGISGKRDLHISSVIHKAFVEVNEEGTEAAAATSIIMNLRCALIPHEFVVNHPFLFLIRDVKSNNILFVGSLLNP